MPRRSTTFRSGINYHVYNRAVDGDRLFPSDQLYLRFIQKLKAGSARANISIVAYCLMPNHFHLLLRPARDDGVSPFVQGLCSSHTQSLNSRLDRQGALFSGRFKSIAVREETYFLHLARYIHLNPVTAGLVTAPEDWPYSNYTDILRLRRGVIHDGSLVPDRFATPNAYQAFVEGDTHNPPPKLDRYLLDS